ncbi:MAG: nitroreductase family protein [Rikenellaceae bacterium]
MEFKDVVSKRRSVRKFSPRKIEREVLESILESAIAAPSSRNSHSTSFMVVSRPELLEQIATMRDYGSAFVKGAPTAILVMGDRTKTDLSEVNCSISATMLQLAITDAGLSSCWVHVAGRPQKQAEPEGAQAQDLLRSILPIPEECDILCLVALGYSDFEPAPLPEFDRTALVSYVE